MENTIEKLNQLLHKELGSNPFGGPLFKWGYSEDLKWPQKRLGYNWKASPEGVILMPSPISSRMRMTSKKNQWMICAWHSRDELGMCQYRDFFDHELPADGYYIHTNGALKPGALPDMICTEWAIRCIKKQRSPHLGGTEETRSKNLVYEWERQQDAEDKSAMSAADSIVDDALPAFMNIPGSRSTNVSVFSSKKETVQ
jgi:hypothetical protein